MASVATRSLLTAPVTSNNYVLVKLYGSCLHNCFTGLECSDHGHLLDLFMRVLLTVEAHRLILGKHEVPVAGVLVTLLPVTKLVSSTNYVAALPLLHSVTEGRS